MNKVKIYYINHRYERSWREIMPDWVYFGKTEWHPEPQWLLKAFDYDKDAERTFAMQDILAWEQIPK